MELICLRTTRAGNCQCDRHWIVISLGKMQFIHLGGREKIVESDFLQVQINKMKLNSMADRNIIEACSTFFCLPLSLCLSAWWETSYLNDHEIWILFPVILQYIYCNLLKCSPFPVEWFQTLCFLTDYLMALKNPHFLPTGFKGKDSQARLGQLSSTDPCSVPMMKDLPLNKPRNVLPKLPLPEASWWSTKGRRVLLKGIGWPANANVVLKVLMILFC